MKERVVLLDVKLAGVLITAGALCFATGFNIKETNPNLYKPLVIGGISLASFGLLIILIILYLFVRQVHKKVRLDIYYSPKLRKFLFKCKYVSLRLVTRLTMIFLTRIRKKYPNKDNLPKCKINESKFVSTRRASLSSSSEPIILAILQNEERLFEQEFACAAERYAETRGLCLLTEYIEENEHLALEYIEAAQKTISAAGILFQPGNNQNWIKRYLQEKPINIPVVLVYDEPFQGLDKLVMFDNSGGSKKVAALSAGEGFRRNIVVSGPRGLAPIRQREESFEFYINNNNKHEQVSLDIVSNLPIYFGQDEDYKALSKLRKVIIKLDTEPALIYALNSKLAIVVTNEIFSMYQEWPKDCVLVCFDRVKSLLNQSGINLYEIDTPIEWHAQVAVEQLWRSVHGRPVRIEDGIIPVSLNIQTE
ncbi:hypothetical protein ACFLWS_04450 [Chloroflexota bacterium]